MVHWSWVLQTFFQTKDWNMKTLPVFGFHDLKAIPSEVFKSKCSGNPPYGAPNFFRSYGAPNFFRLHVNSKQTKHLRFCVTYATFEFGDTWTKFYFEKTYTTFHMFPTHPETHRGVFCHFGDGLYRLTTSGIDCLGRRVTHVAPKKRRSVQRVKAVCFTTTKNNCVLNIWRMIAYFFGGWCVVGLWTKGETLWGKYAVVCTGEVISVLTCRCSVICYQ